MATILASHKESGTKRYAVMGDRLVDRIPETGELLTERVVLYEDDELVIARLAFDMYDTPGRRAELIDRHDSE